MKIQIETDDINVSIEFDEDSEPKPYKRFIEPLLTITNLLPSPDEDGRKKPRKQG